MDDALIDMTALGGDLDAAGRRRLWILGKLIERSGVADMKATLSLAALLEEFVVSGNRLGQAVAPTPLPLEAPASQSAVVARQPDMDPARQNTGFLLDQETRLRFVEEAARNPDNRHLAAHFGLTVRQAHAVRVAFRRMIAAHRAEGSAEQPPYGDAKPTLMKTTQPSAPPAFTISAEPTQRPTPESSRPSVSERPGFKVKRVARPPELDRATELRMQEEFLAAKAPPTYTLDDIIRFLRQQGDVVLSEDGGYRVNFAQKLTAEQLIARANEKRRQKGLERFLMAPLPGSSPAPASAGSAA